MADYSGAYEHRQYTPAELAAQKASKEAYDRAVQDRVEDYLAKAKKILDRGNVVDIRSLVDLVIAECRPNEDEIWIAVRSLMFDTENGYGEITYGKWGALGG